MAQRVHLRRLAGTGQHQSRAALRYEIGGGRLGELLGVGRSDQLRY